MFKNLGWIFFIQFFVMFADPLLLLGQEIIPEGKDEEEWSLHFQTTMVSQGHPSFASPYSGANSFSSHAESATSLTSTLFVGKRVWKNGEIYFNPELLAGNGLSSTLGIAGSPNGEIYRVDNPDPKFNLSRFYLKQIIAMGGPREYQSADLNQLAGFYDQKRFTLLFGKFSLTDFFDNNRYSDDPRTQFLNWSIMYNGAWDFAADTRGYTWGIVLELHQPSWAIRFGSVQVPEQANQMSLDGNLSRAHGDNLELEYRYLWADHPGAVRLMSYANHARMGNYREAVINPNYRMDVTQTREYRVKYGFGLNLEQEISPDLGTAMRIGWNDGATETWAFTEIDRTVSIIMSLKGNRWKRPADTLGVAAVVNGLSQDHADYLAAGGYGFIIGDGRLNYAPEEVLETYYLWKPVPRFGITPEFQFINHPAFNSDRGPVFIFGGRAHYEF